MLKIAVNTSRDYYRSKYYKNKIKEIELNDNLFNDKVIDIDINDIFSQREKIKQAIEELPNDQKEAIILKFYHDFKIKEIADITGSKEAAIKYRLKQGINKLQNILEEGDYLEEVHI